ncbi:hypothetical protein LR48_Vigan743s001000 [Vigna angularis]|uniref:Putative plant transposon protein domain-containing protein n=1 Tax=Phaseolus angularis TaxID=3914 RepID=A0A0L9TGV0_PHAAN|nr:hypothetical protein LR48_Vigan743s001000 [Vigna angularis]
MAASSPRPGKRPSPLVKEANPFGWFSDNEKQNDFICQWGFKEVIRHKRLSINFFCVERFMCQEWLVHFGLTKFVELEGDYYQNLVKVFYANLKKERNYLLSKVKGVTICIDEAMWRCVAKIQQGGYKSHLGIPGLNKIDIYNNYFRNPYRVRNYYFFCIDHLSKEDKMCASVITWILLPRKKDQTMLTAKDMYLLRALRTKIQTNWTSVISDQMIKVARKKEYYLPYVVFISRILRFHGVDITNEVTICCNKKDGIEKLFLDHIGLRKSEEGWIFKDEYYPGTDEFNPVNIDISKDKFKPLTGFEKFVVERFSRLDDKMPMLQRSFAELHRKMDYALKINAFSDTSIDYSDSEKNYADEKILKSSELE